MQGETNLATLLKNMQPQLSDRPFVFCTVDRTAYNHLAELPLGLFQESEGITVILEKASADQYQLPYANVWALITLTIHSDLTAVGFLAAITTKLAAANVSVNPVSAYYHDHLFVPWEMRDRTLALLQNFSST